VLESLAHRARLRIGRDAPTRPRDPVIDRANRVSNGSGISAFARQ
jgi:hypothetical protein